MADNALRGESGTEYKVVAGVIQNNGAGIWQLIPGAHSSINIASVSADSSKIRVTYTFTATAVCTFQATADDDFIVADYATGASVGVSFADVYIAHSGSASNPTTTNVTGAAIWLFGIFEA